MSDTKTFNLVTITKSHEKNKNASLYTLFPMITSNKKASSLPVNKSEQNLNIKLIIFLIIKSRLDFDFIFVTYCNFFSRNLFSTHHYACHMLINSQPEHRTLRLTTASVLWGDHQFTHQFITSTIKSSAGCHSSWAATFPLCCYILNILYLFLFL